MAHFFNRYIAGERKQVWAELQELGEAVRHEPIYTDACDVVRETMVRVRQNIETIIKRLREIGYEFAYEGLEYQPASANAELLTEELEHKVGSLPLSLHFWYVMVGGVNLMGTHPSWNPASYSVEDGNIIYSDPLVVDPIDAALEESYYLNVDTSVEHSSYLSIAPDIYHKANISGGGPDLIRVPDYSLDGLLEMTTPKSDWVTRTAIRPSFIRGWTYGVLFVDYLRHSFEWGGFPGFAYIDKHLRPTEMMEYLKEELLPI